MPSFLTPSKTVAILLCEEAIVRHQIDYFAAIVDRHIGSKFITLLQLLLSPSTVLNQSRWHHVLSLLLFFLLWSLCVVTHFIIVQGKQGSIVDRQTNRTEFNGMSNVYEKSVNLFSSETVWDVFFFFFLCCNFTFVQVQSDMFLNITMLTACRG